MGGLSDISGGSPSPGYGDVPGSCGGGGYKIKLPSSIESFRDLE